MTTQAHSFSQPTPVNFFVVVRPLDGEVLQFCTDEKALVWIFNRSRSEWFPWGDDQAKYQ